MKRFRKRTSQVIELQKIYFSAKLTGLGPSWSTFLLSQGEVFLDLGYWTSVSVEHCQVQGMGPVLMTCTSTSIIIVI